VYHDAGNSRIVDAGTGNLNLQADNNINILNNSGTEFKAQFITNGAVNLFYDNSKKLETTATGVDVTGGLNTTGNVGIGCTPDSALEIRTATNSSSDTTYLKLSNLGENVGHIDFENGNGNLARITGTKLGAGASANDGILTFSTAFDSVLSEHMRIDSSGNVNISGSSGATLKLTSTDTTGANTELLGQIDFVSSDSSGGSAGTQG
jgi:hypothetical protein